MEAEASTVSEVTPRLELRLEDGRLVLLANVERLAEEASGARAIVAARELASLLGGRRVLVRPDSPFPDRWGRGVADVFGPLATEASGPFSPPPHVGEALVAAGLLRVAPRGGDAGCRQHMLQAEELARAAGFGIWAEAEFAPVAAADIEALANRDGQFTLVEGTVRRIGVGRARTYIDFGGGRGGFSLTVAKRPLRLLAAGGIDVMALAGRRLRARGVIDTRFGPQIEIFGPEQIEMLDGAVDEPLTKPVDNNGGR